MRDECSMLLPGLFAPNSLENSDGKGFGPLASSEADGAATGFDGIFSRFRAELMPASAPITMAKMAMPFGGDEAGQGLPLERQSLGFQGIRLEQEPLPALQLSLVSLEETIDQLLALQPEQRAELEDFLSSELGLTEAQQQEVFELLQQWQQSPPTIALTTDQLNAAGQAGLDAVTELREILDLLNEELSIWLNEATGQRTEAEDHGSRLENIRNNPFLAQWLLGEGRPDKGVFSAADWLAQTMQNLLKAASSGSIPMTLEPMRPEALLLESDEAEPLNQARTLDLELLTQSRQTRAEVRMEGLSLTSTEAVALTVPERGLAPAKAEEKGLLGPSLERLQRPIPMAQASQVLSERLVVMIQNEVRQATIRLDPPELGMMDIRIQVQNDQTQVQIVVQTPQVREALESQSTRLREYLEQQGLGLANLDVTDQQQQGERQGDERQASSDALARQGDEGDEELERPVKSSLGLVDHFV